MTLGRARRDRGSASLELAVLFPALILIVVGVVQAGLWFYARSVALAAAEEGVRAGRAENAAPGAAHQAAASFAGVQSRDNLSAVEVSAETSPEQVRVTVSGRALSLVPGLPIAISQTSSGAVERLTSPAGAP